MLPLINFNPLKCLHTLIDDPLLFLFYSEVTESKCHRKFEGHISFILQAENSLAKRVTGHSVDSVKAK